MSSLESRLKQQAHGLGFDLVGLARAAVADTYDRLRDWLERGFAGDMHYLEQRAEARRHPSSILVGVRSVVMVGLNYKTEDRRQKTEDRGQETGDGGQRTEDRGQRTEDGGQRTEDRGQKGKIARYAWGLDYHEVMRAKLKQLLSWVQGERPGTTGRAVVDTAPLLERDFARRAGLGWIGKNTMLLNKKLGSYFFLGALLLDLDLQPDAPHDTSHCGTCTACLDECPTQAFVAPMVLDARRCISYLTIESRGPMPQELRPQVGDWLFGCDVCQEVCPWNKHAPATTEPAFAPQPALDNLDLADLLNMSEADFRSRFRGTALRRAKLAGLQRNAAVVLENAVPSREASNEPRG